MLSSPDCRSQLEATTGRAMYIPTQPFSSPPAAAKHQLNRTGMKAPVAYWLGVSEKLPFCILEPLKREDGLVSQGCLRRAIVIEQKQDPHTPKVV